MSASSQGALGKGRLRTTFLNQETLGQLVCDPSLLPCAPATPCAHPHQVASLASPPSWTAPRFNLSLSRTFLCSFWVEKPVKVQESPGPSKGRAASEVRRERGLEVGRDVRGVGAGVGLRNPEAGGQGGSLS